MSRSDAWRSTRRVVAARDGYRCVYCRVPTAATIEHVDARSQSNDHDLLNLRLACPWCNTHKRDLSVEEFLERGLWRLPEPERVLPGTTLEMLEREFGWRLDGGRGTVATGSAHAQLELANNQVYLLVRASKEDDWQRLHAGAAAEPAVVIAGWAFLRRHYTRSRAEHARSLRRFHARKDRS